MSLIIDCHPPNDVSTFSIIGSRLLKTKLCVLCHAQYICLINILIRDLKINFHYMLKKK